MSRLLRRTFLFQSIRVKKVNRLNLLPTLRNLSTEGVKAESNEETSFQTYNFKTETHKLLDIVANSLYSEKEVFLRELISNSADALEKLRYLTTVQPEIDINLSELKITLELDKENGKLILKDTGVGFTEEELHEHLGTIAKSGSKAFVDKLTQSQPGESSNSAEKIIGQFGVGFYSGFMVGTKLEVYTRSSLDKNSQGYLWTSDGLGSYKVSKVDGVEFGTKVVIQLKESEKKYLDKDRIRQLVKKYSNFVSFPIQLEGETLNEVQPIWLKPVSEVDETLYKKFYHTLSQGFDDYQYKLLYKTDAPISIKALLFLPKQGTDFLGNSTATQGIHLYSRQVLIQPNSTQLLPTWLRFVKGVVDSEDIPLNLSRELLQNGQALRQLKRVLTAKVVSWLKQESKKDLATFNQFYAHFNRNFKEAVLLEENAEFKTDVIDLLRFSSDKTDSNQFVTLRGYWDRKVEHQKSIYYLNRTKDSMLASPYYEPFQKANVEVLAFDDIVDKALANAIPTYQNIPLVDIESKKASEEVHKFQVNTTDDQTTKLTAEEVSHLTQFLQHHLQQPLSLKEITVGTLNTSYPILIKDHELDNDPYLRQMLKQSLPQGQQLPIVPINIELNPYHPINLYLAKCISKDSEIEGCKQIFEQLILNAKLQADLLDDPKVVLNNINPLVQELLKLKLGN